MRNKKQLLAAALSCTLIFTCLPASASAAVENTSKEEVVYVNLNPDGSVLEINVVNILTPDSSGQITDYGSYSSLRNMTTTDTIQSSDDLITIDTKSEKLYYEGKLETTVIPWNINIHYYLDGTEYTATEIAGKSGSLKITLEITENTVCQGSFFECYTLQATLTLDTHKCRNINAEGATLANVGSDKQLTYTILPGSSSVLEITAEVQDFEMDAITINGVRLQMDYQLDADGFSENLTTITDAITRLDEGAASLQQGAAGLTSATAALTEKTGELSDGTDTLAAGAKAVSDGLSDITQHNDALITGAYQAYEGLCAAAETLLNTEFAKNGLPAITLTPENYTGVLGALLEQLPGNTTILVLKEQLDSYQTFYQSLTGYTTAVSAAAAGAMELETGITVLSDNTKAFHQSSLELSDAMSALSDGVTELKNDTGTFVQETENLDTRLSTEIDRALASAFGEDVPVTSFTSEKNTNIESVQFCLKTSAIKVPEVQSASAAAPEKLNFWQKLLRLFGLY